MADEKVRRVTAHVVNSRVFSDGDFVAEDNFSNYILYHGKKLFKVNILGAVVSRNDGNNFISVMIDDGFGMCEARAFGDAAFFDFTPGDIVQVVGRPRRWQDTVYLNADFIKKVDPLWAKHRRLMLCASAPISDVAQTQENSKKSDNLPEKILETVASLDKGDGADIDAVIDAVGGGCEEVVDKMIERGELFEFRPGRIKPL